MRKTAMFACGLCAALVLAGVAPASAADGSSTPSQRSITVSGDGTATVRPDVAFVTVGVQQAELQAGKAQDEANAIIGSAIARIKALGVPDRDIQTAGISLDPQYDDRGVVVGFMATDTLAITVEQPNRAGAVIDAGVGAGANHSVSVSFGLKDTSVARTAALRAAVAVAQRKATAVAAQIGISLQGAKVQVTENSTQPVPVPIVQTGVAAPNRIGSTPTPIQTGSLTVADSVTVTYTF